MQIKEFAELTGVSVRTLHYYDETGLLKPAFTNEQNGYREYDEKSFRRMTEILFYRELDFSLNDIARILSSPDYDRRTAIIKQKELLILKKERLENLIDALEKIEKGESPMNTFKVNEYEKARKEYEAEAKARWGNTDAYKESERKAASYSKEKMNDINAGLNCVLAEFADALISGISPESEAAEALVRKLQDYITENFYTCTNEILAGLGQMYVSDERFKENIDKNGKGTADFISSAIKNFCK